MKMGNNLVGLTFGRLTVIEKGDDYIRKDGRRETTWKCECSCGKVISALGYNLSGGRTKSCGCLMKDCGRVRGLSNKKHGMYNNPLYKTWWSMVDRATNPHNKRHERYYDRGITVCDEWLKDPVNFCEWSVKNGWEPGLQLDRIDNDRGYSPDNCRYVTITENVRNRECTLYANYYGIERPLAEWCDLFDVNYKTVWEKLNRGVSLEDALLHL